MYSKGSDIMNKRNKIIVSIVGITIVLLALLGITYAYYLTRIQGNTNTNSISVTTAKLELTYGDGNGILLPYGTIEPNSDKSIKFYKTDASGNPITNEPPVDNKTFTVTNNGNDSSYVVIIDNVSVTKVSDGSATTFVSNDFRYTLSCKKSDNTDCNNVSDLTIFPIKGGILVSNDIEEDDVHTYTLTMWYIDTGIDQSDDMGKSLQARVNITDVAQMENPFMTGVTATDNASLAYNIINNAKTNKNGTQFVNTPLTIPSAEISNVTNYKSIGEETNFSLNLSIENSYSSKTWYYYDTYVVDETSGKFTLTGKQSCTYSSCYSNLVGKYLYNKNPANNSNANNHTSDTKTNLPNVYKVTEATASTLKYVQVFNSPNEAERVLAPTTDDYGTSYYYRGAVEDNYLTFAGMCWRIVRIAGDGSVKIVLEDQDEACSTSMNGNWGIPTTTGGTTYTGNYGYELKNVDGEYGQEYIMSYLKPVNSAYKSMARAFYDFQEDKLEDYKSKLKSGNWCLADKAYTQSGSFPNYTYTLLEEYNY